MRRAVVGSTFVAAVVVAASSRAHDPYFGPSAYPGATPVGGSRVLVDAVEDFEQRFVHADRPGVRGIEQPLARPSGRLPSTVRRDVFTRLDDHTLRLFHGLQVRRSGAADHVIGPGLPVDLVTGVLPGRLLALRLGAALGAVGAYAIVGGGTFTSYRHRAPQGDAEATVVTTGSSGFGFVGVGAEVRLPPSVGALVLAAEFDWGRVAERRGNGRLVAPDPAETVSTAVCALRVEY
ncbi:MAG: hypothetical protein HYV09_26350 [Deltaproteobacteria bacterium]|nr:hypothetical protein [Deltaproteobacteria bacterium]